MKCPMMFAIALPAYEVTKDSWTCKEGGCAWWVDFHNELYRKDYPLAPSGGCAITSLAIDIHESK